MGKWNANKIQPKLNQSSRGPDTKCLDTLTPRTLDKAQDLLSQVIYPDIGYIAMLIEICFLGSGKMTMQNTPSPSTTQVTVSPMLSSKFESWKRERNPVKSAGTAEGRQHTILSKWETQEKEKEGSTQCLTQNPDSSALQGRTGRGNWEILDINLNLKLVCQAASDRSPQIGNSPLYKAFSSCAKVSGLLGGK